MVTLGRIVPQDNSYSLQIRNSSYYCNRLCEGFFNDSCELDRIEGKISKKIEKYMPYHLFKINWMKIPVFCILIN